MCEQMSIIMDIVQRKNRDEAAIPAVGDGSHDARATQGRVAAERGDVRVETVLEIAALYYYEDVTQEALSHRFSMSRAKVGRLLKRARAEGLVEIRVHQPPTVGADLEQE